MKNKLYAFNYTSEVGNSLITTLLDYLEAYGTLEIDPEIYKNLQKKITQLEVREALCASDNDSDT